MITMFLSYRNNRKGKEGEVYFGLQVPGVGHLGLDPFRKQEHEDSGEVIAAEKEQTAKA